MSARLTPIPQCHIGHLWRSSLGGRGEVSSIQDADGAAIGNDCCDGGRDSYQKP